MGKHMIPEDPKEQDLKNGPANDFGMFLGGDSGYTIEEGTEEEIAMSTMKYNQKNY